ncbi:hypothetical protein B0H17DRAFT_1137356 [Mycena rosella]|uniref:Uncharacterized protein n=1 Tax=Mycena rosella TaxID=1033263 RepID=A0AAD7GEZ0_MYCRO|nr:hypothetical protein B0H17DRAFT_1137356 [Mycena rosella]
MSVEPEVNQRLSAQELHKKQPRRWRTDVREPTFDTNLNSSNLPREDQHLALVPLPGFDLRQNFRHRVVSSAAEMCRNDVMVIDGPRGKFCSQLEVVRPSEARYYIEKSVFDEEKKRSPSSSSGAQGGQRSRYRSRPGWSDGTLPAISKGL